MAGLMQDKNKKKKEHVILKTISMLAILLKIAEVVFITVANSSQKMTNSNQIKLNMEVQYTPKEL